MRVPTRPILPPPPPEGYDPNVDLKRVDKIETIDDVKVELRNVLMEMKELRRELYRVRLEAPMPHFHPSRGIFG